MFNLSEIYSISQLFVFKRQRTKLVEGEEGKGRSGKRMTTTIVGCVRKQPLRFHERK